MLIAFHREAQAIERLEKSRKQPGARPCRFPKMTLSTSKLKEQREFYADVLSLPVKDIGKASFSVQIGESTLTFKEVNDGSNPFYHYAINIPSNQHLQAKEWLSKRTPLLKANGSDSDLLYFDFWDAHAMYFKDPAGNIGELIARHTLDNDSEGEFGVSDLLYLSEIGMPVEDPLDLAAELKEAYGLGKLGESMFIGDEYGLFVAVPVDRLWFPEYTQHAKIHPTEVTVTDKGADNFSYKNYPYRIQRERLDNAK